MVYIAADGSVVNGPRPIKASRNPFKVLLKKEWRIAIVVAVAMALKFKPSANPLANGAIPAALVGPEQHWKRIAKDDTFVRTMTENLDGSQKKATKEGIQAEERAKIYSMLERVDFGGANGHVAELADYSDLESIQVTRCSTSQSAVTAYFCGAAVASNQDVALGRKRKAANFGIGSFKKFIKCRHEQGVMKNGQHRRSVYRLGIGCLDNLAGYSHAFSIIAQPDGSFYWLQSFIGHYSLSSWMNQVDRERSLPLGHLSLSQLLSKLDQMDRLMKVRDWTDQANSDYLELFGVDKKREASKNGKIVTWKPTHRLSQFTWDEACEYPLPPTEDDDSGKEPPTGNDTDDQCQSALRKHAFEELEELMGQLEGRLEDKDWVELLDSTSSDISKKDLEVLKDLLEDERFRDLLDDERFEDMLDDEMLMKDGMLSGEALTDTLSPPDDVRAQLAKRLEEAASAAEELNETSTEEAVTIEE